MCRYLNSVAAKALFRAGRIEEAEAMAAKFTKHGEQVNSLTEMQAMWYEIECGHAHLRRRAYGKVTAPVTNLKVFLPEMSLMSGDEQLRKSPFVTCHAISRPCITAGRSSVRHQRMPC